MTAAHSSPAPHLVSALLAASALLALAGCSSATTTPPSPAPDTGSASGTRPSGPPDPETHPDEANAYSVATVLSQKSREWITAWDAAACTGERAAEDVRECQALLMDLADEADGVADLLEQETAALDDLAASAEAARAVADAATEWLDGWCGAYADPACAEPGTAVVDAQRLLDSALDPWLPRATDDA